MSAYENAPATALVAKSCCICGRPLVEAESIASGIGPKCAERTGYGRPNLPPEVRAEVNKIVYELAALQRRAEAIPRLDRLRELGFGLIADRIAERLGEIVRVQISLRTEDDRLVLELPRIEDRAAFARLLADLRAVPGRRVEELGSGTATRKYSTIPNQRVPILALHRVLARHLAGEPARSPKGLFIVPTEIELDRVLAGGARRAPMRIDVRGEQQVLELGVRHA